MKGIIKRCSLYALSLIVLSIPLSVLLSVPSYASSAYDSVYQTTNSISYSNTSAGCSEVLVDNGYRTLLDTATWQNSAIKAEYISALDTAIASGDFQIGQWSNAGNKHIEIFYTPSGGAGLNWQADRVNYQSAANTNNYSLTIMTNAEYNGGNDCSPYIAYTGKTNNAVIGDMGYVSIAPYMYAYRTVVTNENIPIGYAGTPIVSSDPIIQTIERPTFKGNVNVKQLTITDTSVAPTTTTTYKLHYLVTQGTYDTGNLTPLYFYEGNIDALGSITINLPELNQVSVRMWYADTDGNILPDTPEVDYRERNQTFNVDGSSFKFDSDGTVCDENDVCVTAPVEPKYKDCSIHNLNLVFFSGGVEFSFPTPLTIACVVNNFWTMVTDFLQGLLTPVGSPDNPFSSFNTDDHGLLAVITAPLSIFVALQSAEQTCTPVNVPLPYVNSQLQLPCMMQFYQNTMGDFLSTYQTIVGGIISYYVLLNMLDLVKGSKDPQNDKIQAMDM